MILKLTIGTSFYVDLDGAVPDAIFIGQERFNAATEAAVEQLEQAVRLAPEYRTARYALGQALRTQGRSEEALEHLRRAERHRAEPPPLDDPLMDAVDALRTGAIDALHRGIDLLHRGRIEPAIILLEESVRIDPKLAEAHAQLGAARLSLGEPGPAEESLRRALDLDPGYVDALYNLGVIAHRRGDYVTAVARFEEVLAIRPHHFDARLGLGTDVTQVGRGSEAVDHLHRALALRPDDPRPYKRLGAALSAGGRYEQAIEALRLGVERLPGDASIADQLALLLATCPREDLRDPTEALLLAEAVCRTTGRAEPRALETLAVAQAALERFGEAAATAEEAIALARRQGKPDIATRIEVRLRRYREQGLAPALPPP